MPENPHTAYVEALVSCYAMAPAGSTEERHLARAVAAACIRLDVPIESVLARVDRENGKRGKHAG